MSQNITQDTSQYTDNKEHNSTFSVKNVMPYGYDGANAVALAVDSAGKLLLSSLVPEAYDYISLSYTGTNLTGVVYKTNGSGGTTVATLTLGYDGSDNLITVTRS